jgi:superfamily II DNA/RNA helicase
MAQTLRFSTLEKFKAGDLQLLVCSDVAARGIDIGGLSHVFNFDVPIHAEDYVHRIGRTGRAGQEGKAFTIAVPEDRYHVEQIEKLIGHPIPPIIVEGLDPVDWAEKDSRKRRGRKTEAKKSDEKKTRKDRPRADRVRQERAAQPDLPPAVERPERHERRDEPRRYEARRDDRRDRYRRDDDLGPAVVGFGDEIPAFMFLRARRTTTENRETDS